MSKSIGNFSSLLFLHHRVFFYYLKIPFDTKLEFMCKVNDIGDKVQTIHKKIIVSKSIKENYNVKNHKKIIMSKMNTLSNWQF